MPAKDFHHIGDIRDEDEQLSLAVLEQPGGSRAIWLIFESDSGHSAIYDFTVETAAQFRELFERAEAKARE